MVDLGADADERPARVERPAQDVEQRRALLEHLEQSLVALELLAPQVFEQACGTADVEALLLRRQRLVEERAQHGEEGSLVAAQRGLVEPAPQQMTPELEAADPVVEVLRAPVRQTRVDRLGKPVDALGDAAGGGDHDDHHDLWLEEQHLDVTHRGRAERRGRHEREQPRQLGEHLGGRLQRRLDLGPSGCEVEREAAGLRVEPLEQSVRVVAVAALGRDPAGGGVRVRQQPERLELGELAPYRRRRDVELRPFDERARADRLPGRDVLLDDAAQDRALTLVELDLRRGRHVLCRDFRQAAPP